MTTRWILLLLPVLLASGAMAGEREFGIEFQAYPTGTIAAVGGKVALRESRHFLTFRAGYNDADRDDDGERGDERGGGPGYSIGWRMMLQEDDRGWFAGARGDVWLLEIDWIDFPGTPGEIRGTTDVIVLQPTALGGYRFPFGSERRWVFEPAASLGFEWNVDTDGADVGDGAIFLLGATISRRF